MPADPRTRVVLSDEYDKPTRLRVDCLNIYASAMAGRPDVDAGKLTRGAETLFKYVTDGAVVPKP